MYSLFRIPSREHNSPQRFPPLFEQRAQSAHRLVHRSGPTVGVAGAKGPRVVVVAEDDDFVRLTGNESVRVPVRQTDGGPLSPREPSKSVGSSGRCRLTPASKRKKQETHQIGVTFSSTILVNSTTSSPGPVQYSTPLSLNPPSFHPSIFFPAL